LRLEDPIFGGQIFDPRQQLLVHRPRDVGQDARPIHSSSPAADSPLIASKNRSQHHPARLRLEWPTHRVFYRFNFLTQRAKNGDRSSRIRSLYEGLYRTVILFGLLIAAAWLFAVFSYYLSRKMGSDWISRSVMALVGAAVSFRLANAPRRSKCLIIRVHRAAVCANA
jgi:hypothetical protein